MQNSILNESNNPKLVKPLKASSTKMTIIIFILSDQFFLWVYQIYTFFFSFFFNIAQAQCICNVIEENGSLMLSKLQSLSVTLKYRPWSELIWSEKNVEFSLGILNLRKKHLTMPRY